MFKNGSFNLSFKMLNNSVMKTGWVLLWDTPWFCCDFCLKLFSLLKQNKNSLL